MTEAGAIDVPNEWRAAITGLGGCRRIAVLGPTDSGKSSFVRALIAGRPALALLDLDPGQKMVGAPGTLSLARSDQGELRLQGFVFLGSTSSADIHHLTRGAARLAETGEPFVANTSGFVRGLGARLQATTLAALAADAVVTLGEEAQTTPILEARPKLPAIRLPASPSARRKSPALRAAIRQAAFAEALRGAEEIGLARAEIEFEPAPPVVVEIGRRHPVCCLAGRGDLAVGILLAADEWAVRVFARRPLEPVATVRLGRMWAEPAGAGWKLLEALAPSWVHEEPGG